MRRSQRMIIFTAFLVTLAAPGVLFARPLEEGIWSGTMTPPTVRQATEVTYEVTYEDGNLSITMRASGGREARFAEIRFDEGRLLFSWIAGGLTLQCALEPQEDGSYRGSCASEGGSPGRLEMIPPAKSDDET